MKGVRYGGKTVKVGDRVRYIVGGSAHVRPATVLDVIDGASGSLSLRVGSRVVKGVLPGQSFGRWTP